MKGSTIIILGILANVICIGINEWIYLYLPNVGPITVGALLLNIAAALYGYWEYRKVKQLETKHEILSAYIEL